MTLRTLFHTAQKLFVRWQSIRVETIRSVVSYTYESIGSGLQSHTNSQLTILTPVSPFANSSVQFLDSLE